MFIPSLICSTLVSASGAMTALVDSAAAEAAVCDYTNNVLRVVAVDPSEWSVGKNGRVTDLLPANMAFQLAVGPDAEDRRMAELAIATVTNSLPSGVREHYAGLHVIAPVVQTLLRRCRPGVATEADHLSPKAHPSVWRAQDFDLPRLEESAKLMTSNGYPLSVFLQPVYGEYAPNPIERAVPTLDYPDLRREATFETPFGAGIVLRAPENARKFRFRVRAWPVDGEAVTFRWVSVSASKANVASFLCTPAMTPADGYGEITFNWSSVRDRLDVAVFARYGDEPCGAPSIISFYRQPTERRTYGRGGAIETISYGKAKKLIPELVYEKFWTDEYAYDILGRPTGFTRKKEGSFLKEYFSADGEVVEETYASDAPKETRKVRYFADPSDPTRLLYEVEPEIRTRPDGFNVRNRGEFFPKRRR